MKMSNLNALEFERESIFKRLKILKILAVVESVTLLYLAFVFSKDLIISLFIAVFVGVFFYRFLSRRLLARQNELENKLLQHFLAEHKGKFKGGGLDENALKELALPFELIKTSASVEFARFTLYDINFKNTSGGAFIGVLLVLKNAEFGAKSPSADFKDKDLHFKADLPCIDENTLFEKLNFTHFDTQRLFIKGEFAIIATLQNPFFISPKLSLKENLAQMNANLAKIENLIA